MLAEAPPLVMLIVWDAVIGIFLLVWLMGVVTEIQRSEAIDLSRLLYLPISPKDAFLINYLASHFTLSLAVAFPAMLGLAAGLVVGKGGSMLGNR